MFEQVIWLTGMPRSGTNWLAQILSSCPDVRLKLCPLFSYEFKNKLDEDSSFEEWENFFPQVYSTQSDYMDQNFLRKDDLVPDFPTRNAKPSFLVIKSTRYQNLIQTILEKHDFIKFLGIVRHPCASIYSWLSNPLEFPKDADPKKEWRTGACRKTHTSEFWGFDDWKKVNRLYLKLNQEYWNRFKIIRYEDFILEPMKQTQRLFADMGLPWSDQTDMFLKTSHSRHDVHVRSVFKDPALADRWKMNLDPEIRDNIYAEITGTELERFLVD